MREINFPLAFIYEHRLKQHERKGESSGDTYLHGHDLLLFSYLNR